MAGVTVIVSAAAAASMATSGGSGSHGTSLLAMAGTRATTGSAAARLDVGTPMTGVARREMGSLGAQRVIAERAAQKAAARRAAKRAAERAAQRRAAQQQADQQAAAQQTAAPQNSGGTGGSAPQPSGPPRQIAMAMLGAYGWPSGEFGCLDSLWNEESGWDVYASNPSSGAYGIPQRCLVPRWRAPGRTGRATPPPRSAGAWATSRASTARPAAPGLMSRPMAGTSRSVVAAG